MVTYYLVNVSNATVVFPGHRMNGDLTLPKGGRVRLPESQTTPQALNYYRRLALAGLRLDAVKDEKVAEKKTATPPVVTESKPDAGAQKGGKGKGKQEASAAVVPSTSAGASGAEGANVTTEVDKTAEA